MTRLRSFIFAALLLAPLAALHAADVANAAAVYEVGSGCYNFCSEK